MTVYLIVRAEVEPSVKDQFDVWYQNQHLPDALKAFNALSAKRGWSSVDANVHVAFYEFPDMATADALLNSDIMKGFIKEFDRHWEGKIKRSRELVEFCQMI